MSHDPTVEGQGFDPRSLYDPGMSPRRLLSLGLVSCFWLFVISVVFNSASADEPTGAAEAVVNLTFSGAGLALVLGVLLAASAALGRRNRVSTRSPTGRHL